MDERTDEATPVPDTREAEEMTDATDDTLAADEDYAVSLYISSIEAHTA